MDAHDNLALCVLSTCEVAFGWGRTAETVRRNFYKGKLIGRTIDRRGNLLITYQSAVVLWGQPKTDPFAHTERS